MATLPASRPFTLDTLIARARAVQSAPAQRTSKSKPPPPAHRTLADLERASSLAPASTEPATTPVALALWITIRRCACGSVTRCPPDYALAKYSPNVHSVHYSRADLAQHTTLPRELREKEVSIPWCEACFGASAAAEGGPISPDTSNVTLATGNAEIDALCRHTNAVQDERCPDCLEHVYAVGN